MNAKIVKILVVSSKRELYQRVERMFGNGRVKVQWQASSEISLHDFETDAYDVVLLEKTDPRQTDANVKDLIHGIKASNPTTQAIVLVAPETVDEAMAALKAGTFQYTKLPVSNSELRQLIQVALELKPQPGAALRTSKNNARCDQLIGASSPMQQVYKQIQQAAATDIPVLLLGETGTGKDLTAQAIHRFSSRKRGAYLATNLGALPSELVASELFGHEKGSFTGAVTQRKGLFEQGAKGTLFLDEIEAIDHKVQVTLLRLLEEKYFQRLGGKEKIANRSRLIAASNKDLEALVKKGNFREDLFYRLDVFRITLPPLRLRLHDIQLLVEAFLAKFNRELDRRVAGVEPECMRLLEAYDWPGNVRELKNVIHRAMIACESNTISAKDLPPRFLSCKPSQPTATFEIGTPIEQVEREMIIRTLASVNNNRKQAAELLGISRRAIYNKFEKHNIE